MKAPRGAKTDLVLATINRFAGEFTVSQVEQACPGVSRDMIRRVLNSKAQTSLSAKAVGLPHGGRRKGNYLLVRVIKGAMSSELVSIDNDALIADKRDSFRACIDGNKCWGFSRHAYMLLRKLWAAI